MIQHQMQEIVTLDEAFRAWANRLLISEWGSTNIVTRGRVHDAGQLQGFVALDHGRPLGLATYHIESGQCEVVSMNSLRPGRGIGSALLDAVKAAAESAGCRRVWLITTNDNVLAMRFYQQRGFSLLTVHRNAVERSRALKPEIPLAGQNGIPIRDEVELELLLPGSKKETIKRLDHAVITIPPDGEAVAREFYCRALGMVEINLDEAVPESSGFRLAIGEQQLHLREEGAAGHDCSKVSLAFEVDELLHWKERLTSHGCQVIDVPQHGSGAALAIEDPFGNRLELIQRQFRKKETV